MVVLLLCIVTVFIIPFMLGIIILFHAQDRFAQFAGWMTLKPLLATPLWFFVTSWLATNASPRLAIYVNWLPGTALTVLLVIAYRQVVLGDSTHPAALRLLGLDFARWISTAVMYATFNIATVTSSNDFSSLGACLIPLAIFMPAIFAVVAYYSVYTASKHKNDDKLKNDDL